MKQNTNAELRQTNITVDLGGMILHPALILGRVRRILRDAGCDQAWIDSVLDEAASGDAEHLVDTLMAVADLRM
jgi:hypothetical protein